MKIRHKRARQKISEFLRKRDQYDEEGQFAEYGTATTREIYEHLCEVMPRYAPQSQRLVNILAMDPQFVKIGNVTVAHPLANKHTYRNSYSVCMWRNRDK